MCCCRYRATKCGLGRPIRLTPTTIGGGLKFTDLRRAQTMFAALSPMELRIAGGQISRDSSERWSYSPVPVAVQTIFVLVYSASEVRLYCGFVADGSDIAWGGKHYGN